ncbi:glycerophosphodiester phosphodiesterase [Catellatospora citrea]|uniref:glycerophosphodiester phosphodiesterase n=1 Tax=Catellatospora citrea TaxID=53366 RepID=A0A8J3KB99_9ACTN|nr:glycerophosphodiester phosphodiesterase [Catellatospora citrea]RKE11776.1 glycerophosphoryl diester phosphodiesterase [Catellatospora citrea]GIF99827.1 glycerophosphoryl diester phosphodiesterase [Catellatospora citrea]
MDRRDLFLAGALGAAVATPALIGVPAWASGDDRDNGPMRDHDRGRPLVVGHRGASGYRPEHTLASYELAARMGADFIEPDLVSTRDGVLVARHENEISGTTDVAARTEFASRRVAKTIDGVTVTGWFTEDFTLAELKTLRAVERLPAVRQRSTVYNGLFEVPTFTEVLQLRERLSKELRREIGVYPETKHPTYFQNIGLPLERPLVAALRREGLDRRDAPVFVQSFEAANLRELRSAHRVKAPLVFLAGAGNPFNDPRSYAEYLSPAGLSGLADVVNGIGPDKGLVIPRAADGSLAAPTSLIADAHREGLKVHPYTFRAENQFLPVNLRNGAVPTEYGRILDELAAYLAAGVDGFFTDNPDLGVLARALHRA